MVEKLGGSTSLVASSIESAILTQVSRKFNMRVSIGYGRLVRRDVSAASLACTSVV